LILDCVGLDLGLWDWCAMFGVPDTTPGPAVGNVVIFLSDSGHLLVM
jgi:hypothetical protein